MSPGPQAPGVFPPGNLGRRGCRAGFAGEEKTAGAADVQKGQGFFSGNGAAFGPKGWGPQPCRGLLIFFIGFWGLPFSFFLSILGALSCTQKVPVAGRRGPAQNPPGFGTGRKGGKRAGDVSLGPQSLRVGRVTQEAGGSAAGKLCGRPGKVFPKEGQPGLQEPGVKFIAAKEV
jgi:hypothetical protein